MFSAPGGGIGTSGWHWHLGMAPALWHGIDTGGGIARTGTGRFGTFSAPGGGTGPGTCTPGWARHNRSASRDRARSFPRERGNAPRPPRRAPPPSGMSHPWKRSRGRGAAGATRDSAPRHGRNVPAREARTGRTGPGAPPGSSRARPRSQRMFPGARRSRRSLRSHTCVSQGRQTRRGRLGSAPDPKPPQSSHRGSLWSREEPPPAPGRWDCGNLVSPPRCRCCGQCR